MEINGMLILNIVNAALGIAVAYFLGKIILSVIKDIRTRNVDHESGNEISDNRKAA